MKTLHIIDSMNPIRGGVCQAVKTIISGGYENQNEVLSLDESGAVFLSDQNFIIHTPGAGKGPWNYNPRFLPWLLSNLQHYDTVVIHGLWLYHTYAVNKAIGLIKKSKKVNVPRLYVMPHGMLDPYFQRASGRKLKAARNWIYWKLIESKLIENADGLLFTCEDERLLARQTFTPYKPKTEHVVGLSVEEPADYATSMKNSFLLKLPELTDANFFLYLGRIHKKKGVDILLHGYKSFLESATKNKNHNPQKLVIAGPGIESPFGQSLLQQVNTDTHLKGNVIFPGMLTGIAKWAAFYMCEAFILPSHQENFGIAVVEALACKKPVLISNKINIWREIADCGGGLVADDTIEGTAKLLTQWTNLPDTEKEIMGHRAYQTYKTHFTLKETANRFSRITCT